MEELECTPRAQKAVHAACCEHCDDQGLSQKLLPKIMHDTHRALATMGITSVAELNSDYITEEVWMSLGLPSDCYKLLPKLLVKAADSFTPGNDRLATPVQPVHTGDSEKVVSVLVEEIQLVRDKLLKWHGFTSIGRMPFQNQDFVRLFVIAEDPVGSIAASVANADPELKDIWTTMMKAVAQMPKHYLLAALPLFQGLVPREVYTLHDQEPNALKAFQERELLYVSLVTYMQQTLDLGGASDSLIKGGYAPLLETQRRLANLEKLCKNLNNGDLIELIRAVVDDDNILAMIGSNALSASSKGTLMSNLRQSVAFLAEAKKGCWGTSDASLAEHSGSEAAALFRYANMSHAFDAKHMIAVVHFLGDGASPEKWRELDWERAQMFRASLGEVMTLATDSDSSRPAFMSFQWYMRCYLIAAVSVIAITNEKSPLSMAELKDAMERLRDRRRS